MTIRATGGFGILRYEPGNPEFPTLPDGIAVPHILTYPDGGGSRHYPNANRGYLTKRVRASAPANDRTRYAGWQTDTTWINPAIVDFGVIPSPVQRTVSLYNARSTTVEVTSLTLPTGVTLISPSLPVTLQPYDGADFILEAGTTGDNEFDENHVFGTSEGDVTFRLIGRRVFTLNNIPQTPMLETLRFRTDLIRSTDGSEKAYGLLQSPSAEVDYKVLFTNDLDRIRFKNQFIAGASVLLVSGQKWYEARELRSAALSVDTTLDINVDAIDASWTVGGPISVVTEEGVAVSGQIDSFQFLPDPNAPLNVVVLRFEDLTDSSSYNNAVSIPVVGPTISTAQSKFGGSSLLLGASAHRGVDVAYDPSVAFLSNDWTIDLWFRPAASDIAGDGMLITRWDSAAGREWYLYFNATYVDFYTFPTGASHRFNFGSPREITVDTWHYLRFCRSGNLLYCFIDGVLLDSPLAITFSITNITGSPELETKIGARYDGGVTNQFDGYIDDVRITNGLARSTANFTPPTERHSVEADQYLELTLGTALGIAAPAGTKVMPAGLGYVSDFPKYKTHPRNLEEAAYSLTFNQETDFAALDPSFPTLTDLQSPEGTLPILEFCNEIRGAGKASRVVRFEDSLDSGLSNRIAFNQFPFADNVSEFSISLYSAAEVWKWRTFLHYLRGSYGEFFVPTFTNDLPGVTTTATNVFDADDTDLALLFGNPPDSRRNAIRLIYPDGTILYRMITQVIDNVATEEITVNSPVNAGNPEIGYLQRCRILGDTATFRHVREGDVQLTFRFRTVLL